MDAIIRYWTQCVNDYISCLAYESIELTNKQEKEIVKRLLDDEEMWQVIGNTIEYHINKVRGDKQCIQ